MLQVSVGQYSDKGRKAVNQDFHGYLCPPRHLLRTKGIAAAIADGISSSAVSHIAAETAVKSLLTDYYDTSEAWSVKNAVRRVMAATNSWLYAQSRHRPGRFDLDQGYVCTFSAIVLKSRSAHLFHIGDTRICHLVGDQLVHLSEAHRVWEGEKSYLTRALGMREQLEMDYQHYTVEVGAILILMTDGVYEHLPDAKIAQLIRENPNDLDLAAKRIVAAALDRGSDDNLTIQIVRIEQLPSPEQDELSEEAARLPLPGELRPQSELDGYRIIRELYRGPRSHLYLAQQDGSDARVIIKAPATEFAHNPDYLERFLMEEWIARRIDSPHLVKTAERTTLPTALYSVFTYIEGQTLDQWMKDNPTPDLETVRVIVEQIAKGLRALHRQEIIHRDLRPQNILIEPNGNVKVIDFGSAQIAGWVEEIPKDESVPPGAVPYLAPEYRLGERGSKRSDLYSLGVIAYQMLSGGHLPYGTDAAKIVSKEELYGLRYRSLRERGVAVPFWVDAAIRKAVHPRAEKRYESLSEFIHDLRHPNPDFVPMHNRSFHDRDPLLFWKTVSFILFFCLLVLILTHPMLLQ